MIGIYSILLGAAIVASALFLLRREFRRAYFIGTGSRINAASSGETDDVLKAIDLLEENVKQMSEAFYDIAGDLEGKYSLHDKELSLLVERIEVLESSIKNQTREIKKIEKEQKKETKKILENNVILEEETFELERRVLETEKREKEVVNKDEQVVEEKLYQVTSRTKPKENGMKDRIIALRSEGYTLRQIAKELDIGLGEIQLILNMKR